MTGLTPNASCQFRGRVAGPSRQGSKSVMKVIHRQAISVAGMAGIAVLGLAGCAEEAPPPAAPQTASSTVAAPSAAPKPMDQPVDPGASLVGPGCADYAVPPQTGPPSVAG